MCQPTPVTSEEQKRDIGVEVFRELGIRSSPRPKRLFGLIASQGRFDDSTVTTKISNVIHILDLTNHLLMEVGKRNRIK